MPSNKAYETAATHFSWPYSTAFQNDFGELVADASTDSVELPVGLLIGAKPVSALKKINKPETRKKQVKPKTSKNPVKAKTAKNAK